MKIGRILIPLVALTGIGVGVAGCSKNKQQPYNSVSTTTSYVCPSSGDTVKVLCTNGNVIQTRTQNVAPGYKRYITDYSNGMVDTVHAVFIPIVNENKKVVDYMPFHFRRINGNQFLQMYDNVTMNFDNIDSAMRTLAKDTLTIAKKVK